MAKKKNIDKAPDNAAAAVEQEEVNPIMQAVSIADGLFGNAAAAVIVGDAVKRPVILRRPHRDQNAASVVEAIRRRVSYILSKHGRNGEVERKALDDLGAIVKQLEV
ncbi:MAG: hypothetical protein HGB35_00050 [Geobacteraceae bacterium]|nr:hypothetical protein [Geobacteraceae bacterium]